MMFALVLECPKLSMEVGGRIAYSPATLIRRLGMAVAMLNSGPTAPDVELQLVRRIAGGDQHALRTVYAQHNVRLFHYLKRWLKDASSAEDVLAEVFIDLWKQASRFEGRSNLNTWLCAIARNKAISHVRKYPLAKDSSEAPDIADETDTPEVNLQKTDKSAKLRACLNRLTVEHREVLDLVYYHEKSINEVADILGVPLNTVKTRMFYARKKLADAMAAAGIDRGWP
jgi:RNA polymerase sigma-70 factor, ECF subfamily